MGTTNEDLDDLRAQLASSKELASSYEQQLCEYKNQAQDDFECKEGRSVTILQLQESNEMLEDQKAALENELDEQNVELESLKL